MGDPTKWKEGSLDAFMKMNHKKEPKKYKKEEKSKFIKNEEKNLEAGSMMSEEERQATLTMAMQYQYHTDSEDEDEDKEMMLSTGLPNGPPSIDNSAW